MNGIDFYRQLQVEHPHMADRVLFISSDTISAQTSGFLQELSIKQLSKPFDVATLTQAVDQFLRSRPTIGSLSEYFRLH